MKLWVVEFIKHGFDLNRIKYRLSPKKIFLIQHVHYIMCSIDFFLNQLTVFNTIIVKGGQNITFLVNLKTVYKFKFYLP